jgi:hypothetical protein
MTPPWWTAADQAELDVLIGELVDLEFEHREHCQQCRAGEPCRAKREAIETVVDWRERRSARSFAVAMRARQDLIEIDDHGGGGRR